MLRVVLFMNTFKQRWSEREWRNSVYVFRVISIELVSKLGAIFPKKAIVLGSK